MAISTIFDFANQVQLYKYNVERNFTILSGQIEAKSLVEQQNFNAKQAIELDTVQQRLTGLLDQKQNVADHLDRIRRARDTIIELKGALADAASAAQAGNRTAFDNALLTLNLKAGNSKSDPDNLIGRLGLAQVGTRTEFVDIPDGDVEIQTQSLSSTYVIDLNDGTQVAAESTANAIRFNGKKYDIPAIQFVSRTGDEVTLEVDNAGTPETYTGTLQRGGLGIANAFYYGGLPSDASPASQAFRDEAVTDVRDALARVKEIDKILADAEIDVQRGFGQLDVEAGATQSQIDTIVDRQADEAKAFSRALQTRTQIALSSIALSAKTAETMLTSMFASQPEPTQTVLDQLGFNYTRSGG